MEASFVSFEFLSEEMLVASSGDHESVREGDERGEERDCDNLQNFHI